MVENTKKKTKPDAETGAPQLVRAIRLPQATAMVVGSIIGAAIFVQPSEISGQIPTEQGVIAVWLVAGVLSLFGALVCAELASIYTESGGVYVYLREIFSPLVGFLWGWALFWVVHTGIIAALAIICARYIGHVVPLSGLGLKLVAIGVIGVLSTVNYFGVRHGSNLQTGFTVAKLAAVAVVILLGLVLGSAARQEPTLSAVQIPPAGARDFLLAVIAGLFAFGGWNMVSYNSEETVEPKRTIPRALTIGMIVVTICYVALNGVYMYVLPLEHVAASTRVAADFADAILGSGGGAVMAGLVVFSTIGALTGIVLSGPRVFFAMARDGLLVGNLARVHPRFRTPHRAIVLQGAWASILVLSGTYQILFSRVIYVQWFFYAAMALGLFLLRYRGVEREYSIWGYPFTPALFMLSALVIVGNYALARPFDALAGAMVVLSGVPVYHYLRQRRRSHRLEMPHSGG